VQNWGYAGRRWDVRQYQEGTLVLDLLDARRGTLVWRAVAEGEVKGAGQSADKIEKTVRKMFAEFPST
jgi:hypothetical protein